MNGSLLSDDKSLSPHKIICTKKFFAPRGSAGVATLRLLDAGPRPEHVREETKGRLCKRVALANVQEYQKT